MGTIEGIKITVSFGHYEREGEHTFLVPDFTYDNELSASYGCISTQLMHFKEEANKALGTAFGKFITDFSKRKE